MNNNLPDDQSIMWIKDPVEDILSSMILAEVCVNKCKIRYCKIQCSGYCMLMIPDL